MIYNKVVNFNPGPGQYKQYYLKQNITFKVKTGVMGPKPKKGGLSLGRPDKGSIYEIPHPDFPGPTQYFDKKLLDMTGQNNKEISYETK